MQYDKIKCRCCDESKYQSFMIPELCRDCVIKIAYWASDKIRAEEQLERDGDLSNWNPDFKSMFTKKGGDE